MKKDYDNYTILVHALKSSAKIVGATELSNAAGRLEEYGDAAIEGDISATFTAQKGMKKCRKYCIR